MVGHPCQNKNWNFRGITEANGTKSLDSALENSKLSLRIFLGAQTNRVLRCSFYLKLSDQLLGSGGRDDDTTCSWRDKAFINGLIDETQQGIIIPIYIQKTHLPRNKKGAISASLPSLESINSNSVI